MATIYCSVCNIEKLLEEINIGLNIGDKIKLNIQIDKSLYYGCFVYYGFKIIDMIERGKKTIVDIIKHRSIDKVSTKKYSALIKLPRTGKDGKRIHVYKLRTMQPYSEYIQDFVIERNGLNDDGTIHNDFRVTKVGKFLRRYWLDELPMFFNLFNGDLKLIGFRPLSDAMLNTYPQEFVLERNRYKPGLIPPYYIDRPKDFEGLIQSEKRYIEKYKKHKFITDTVYFAKFINSCLFKGVRSS